MTFLKFTAVGKESHNYGFKTLGFNVIIIYYLFIKLPNISPNYLAIHDSLFIQ